MPSDRAAAAQFPSWAATARLTWSRLKSSTCSRSVFAEVASPDGPAASWREWPGSGVAASTCRCSARTRIGPPPRSPALAYAGEAVQSRLPPSAERIYKAWTAPQSRLERDAAEPHALAADLRRAYNLVCRTKDIRAGQRVRLPDVHFQIFVERQTVQGRQDPRRSRIKDYPRHQFAWDLAALLDAPDALTAEGLALQEATEAAARSRSQSALVLCSDGARVSYTTLLAG